MREDQQVAAYLTREKRDMAPRPGEKEHVNEKEKQDVDDVPHETLESRFLNDGSEIACRRGRRHALLFYSRKQVSVSCSGHDSLSAYSHGC